MRLFLSISVLILSSCDNSISTTKTNFTIATHIYSDANLDIYEFKSSSMDFNAFIEDKNGNLFIGVWGTDNLGLIKFNGDQFIRLNEQSVEAIAGVTPESPYIQSLALTADNNILAGHFWTSYLSIINDDSVTNLLVNTNTPGDDIHQIVRYDSEHFLILSHDGLFFLFNEVSKTISPFVTDFNPIKVVSMLYYDNQIWLAGNNGLQSYVNSQWTNYDLKSEFSFWDLVKIDSTIWVSSNSGVFKNESGSWINYDQNNSEFETNYIQNLVVDKTGQLWASEGRNLYRFETNKFLKVLLPVSVNENNTIDNLFIDSANRIWIGTGNGQLFCYKKEMI